MLYKKEKMVLKVIRETNPTLTNNYYDLIDVWNDVNTKYPNKIEEVEYNAALKALNEKGFISCSLISTTAFLLTDNGRYYNEYCKHKVLSYIAEKWIDFFALFVSFVSLVMSLKALMR